MNARLALFLAASVGFASAAQAMPADPAKAHLGEAKRHLWTSDVAIEQARLGLQGLYALVDDEDGAWDRAHQTLLLEQVQRDLGVAATHLGHLCNLPANRKEAAMDLTRAETSLAQVQSALKALEAPAKDAADDPATGRAGAEALKKELKSAWHDLDEAAGDFKKLAGDYQVTTRLPSL